MPAVINDPRFHDAIAMLIIQVDSLFQQQRQTL